MNSAARIEAFLEMMSAERGAAENTLSSYRRDLEDASQQIVGGLAGADDDQPVESDAGDHTRILFDTVAAYLAFSEDLLEWKSWACVWTAMASRASTPPPARCALQRAGRTCRPSSSSSASAWPAAEISAL